LGLARTTLSDDVAHPVRVIALWGTKVEVAEYRPPPEKKQVLVIVYGSVRGGDITRDSLLQNVVEHYG